MYRIIGTDGKTYGPVGLEQIRQWLAQGRVDSRTPVLMDGASDWTVLGLLPELAVDFAGTPPRISALRPAGTPARGTNPFATAGLVCGLLAWTCCCCVPFNLLGLVFSLIALVQISSRGAAGRPHDGDHRAGAFGDQLTVCVRAGVVSTGLESGHPALAFEPFLNALRAAKNSSGQHSVCGHHSGRDGGGHCGHGFFL